MVNPPEDWPRVKALFASARGLSVSEQRVFLSHACAGDDRLRLQVEELLAADRNAGSFLETAAPVQNRRLTMPSLEGRRIGPYEFFAPIGAGGMGEVYKAHDHRLERVVAIKVLQPHLAESADAATRFEREARAIAALNHPHVCTVHDVGHIDGVAFLVMEFLYGETLATRLDAGPMGIEQALDISVQIASALDTVHRAGLIHRDLKPGNIMLTKAGAKLLDFGLSRATPGHIVAGSARPVSALTSAGAILGTIQYMSPEQIDGRTADARSDIFAFGCVMYEMLTGHRAFPGATTAEVAEAIRLHEPAAAPTLPPPIDRIVRACLAKDPDDRWQTARDLLRELNWAAQKETERDAHGIPARRRSSRALAAIAATAVLVAAIAAAVVVSTRLRRPTLPQPPSVQFELATPPTNDAISLALSHDGRRLAFVATSHGAAALWIRPLNQTTATPIEGTAGASYPFWSPDDTTVAFFADGKLKTVGTEGGAPHIIADAPTGRGGSWSRDGVIIFAPTTAGGLMRVAATGGTPVAATTLAEGESSHRWPQFLPDGRRFLFLSTQGRGDSGGVFLGSLDRSTTTRILADGQSAAAYAPPDHLLFARGGALMSAPFDPDRETLAGEASVVVRPVAFDTQQIRGAFAVSETGVLAYRAAIASPRQLVWIDRAGEVRGTLGPMDQDGIAAPELTRDGRRVAVFRSVDGNTDVWVVPAGDGVPNRFTFDPDVDAFPLWTPDERHIVFTISRRGTFDLLERSIDGSERRVFDQPELRVPLSFSSDGRFLLYAVQVPQTGVDLWAVPFLANGIGRPFPVAQAPFDEMAGQFSPDGKWIAYQSNASGRMEIYVRPFPESAGQQQLSPAGGGQPRWSPDGKELFYVAGNGWLNAIAVHADPDGRTLDVSAPRALFATHLAAGANIPPAVGSKAQYAVAADGRFLMNISAVDAPAPPISIMTDWHAAK